MDKREYKILQELHRVQEAEIKKQIKARKERTRRLCIIGGVVLSIHPEIERVSIDDLDQAVRNILM